MMSNIKPDILRKLASICELSPDIRMGQLLAHLSLLADDASEHGLADLDDDQLLQVLARHEFELSRRHSNVA